MSFYIRSNANGNTCVSSSARISFLSFFKRSLLGSAAIGALLAGFTTVSKIDTLFGEVEAGLTVLATDGYNLKINYEGRFAKDERHHAGAIKVGIKF